MQKKTIMEMPKKCFWGIIGFCVLGIVLGSVFDFQISEMLANKTKIGSFFATWGAYLSYCLYPAAGTCLFVGLKEKGKKYRLLAWTLLVIAYFIAVYYSNSYNGEKIRDILGYTAGESSPLLSVLAWILFAALYAWVPFVTAKLIDRENPNKLIAVGAAILVAGIIADDVNVWLKQVASRPRYKYLLTLENPISEFRNWWDMIPNLAGSNDNFKSWPSGNMTIASMMFSLPMLTAVSKKQSKIKNLIAFCFACAFVVLYGYNRIHMTNHFLSDVCFGTLITYLIYALISSAFMHAAEK